MTPETKQGHLELSKEFPVDGHFRAECEWTVKKASLGVRVNFFALIAKTEWPDTKEDYWYPCGSLEIDWQNWRRFGLMLSNANIEVRSLEQPEEG